MNKVRSPFQGTVNIIRFNWHYYALACLLAAGVILLWNEKIISAPYAYLLLLFIILPSIISIAVSFYIYDLSGLYEFKWLESTNANGNKKILNVNAGFDETTVILKQLFPESDLITADFYDPSKHTEVSIRRARKHYPWLPGTIRINTQVISIDPSSVDEIYLLFAAHEIRDQQERIKFFSELKRILNPAGKVVVTEHMRDTANFFAYSVGFMHFYSKKTWLKTFEDSGFAVADEIKVTPFITSFILRKHGTAS